MTKLEIIATIWSAVSSFALIYITGKSFKYKDIIAKIIEAAKDARITEPEFQGIIDEVKKEIWPK